MTEFTYEISTEAPAAEVFPLLDPVRENDWVPGWKSFTTMIWSESGFGELGAVFQTAPGGTEPQTWVVTEYAPNDRVAFVRWGTDVITRLTIDVRDVDGKAKLTWTENQVALTDAGAAQVNARTQADYDAQTAGLEAMLNYYLLTGELIDQETLAAHVGGDHS